MPPQRRSCARAAAGSCLSVASIVGPKRFLTVAETMHGVAIGYDWFFDDLSAATRAEVEDALAGLGIAVGTRLLAQNCTWTPGVAGTGRAPRAGGRRRR